MIKQVDNLLARRLLIILALPLVLVALVLCTLADLAIRIAGGFGETGAEMADFYQEVAPAVRDAWKRR
ncbi:hypothetical protein [Amorphus sp. MBR-141]